MLELKSYQMHELGMSAYRMRPAMVSAVQIAEPFQIDCKDYDILGEAGDWVVCDQFGNLMAYNDVQFKMMFKPEEL